MQSSCYPDLDAATGPSISPATEKRPWGRFERFTQNQPSTIKLIYLDGDKRLSLQYHDRRKEFWKVIKGPIRVQLDKETRTLETGESIMIPEKSVHRLMGAGTNAIILEISVGDFDESDIVRLEDDYKR
ncbi:MAG: phosphomannose isomerase type II C-terminal cupin domain [Nitrososphaera sp.]